MSRIQNSMFEYRFRFFIYLELIILNIISLLTLILFRYMLNNIKEVDFMSIEIVPGWMENLDDEDIAFIKRFILASGSLKEVAKIYNVTYPTVRLRLDKLIQKIKINEDETNEPYIGLIKRLAVNDKIDFDTAKILINEYKKIKREE